jgi:formylmethanofuran dehydrogenase subunit A
VTIYAPDVDKRRMFALPRYLIKAGEIILDDGELRSAPEGETLLVAPRVDPEASLELEAWLRREGTVHPANFVIGQQEVPRSIVVSSSESR